MLIPTETIQKIRDEADIVEVIGEQVKLNKKGANYVGLCPFHNDTNPSLTVSPSKRIFTCFSCGATGNVITFVQNFEKVSFVEAVSRLAQKVGIPLEIGTAGSKSQILKKYYDLLEKATNFYQFYLYNTTEGQEALKYLYKRGLNDKIIKRFRIGLAPRDRDLLYRALLQEKFQPLDMIEAGLVRSGKNYYDVFRNRIVFPLEDTTGNIVGFSGRIYYVADTEAKYLNSSENAVFKKGQILYNFEQARNEIRGADSVFIFEGFMDVIAAHRAGIDNALAIMGTALTEHQIQAIKRLTENVTLCFDGDSAGCEATKKGIYLMNNAGINCKAILMPEKYDPDDYINEFGGDKLAEYLVNKPLNGIDYLYLVEKRQLNQEDITSIEEFKNNVFRHLNFFNSNVINEIYLKKMAEDLNVQVKSLQSDFSKSSYRPSITDYQPLKSYVLPRFKKDKYENSEKALIKTLIYHRDKYYEAKDRLAAYTTGNRQNRNILYKLFDYYKNNNEMNLEDFMALLDAEETIILTEILNSPFIGQYVEITELIDTIKKYKYYEQVIQLRDKEKTEENLVKLRENKLSITTIKFKE
ncbi:MAG: DNA primase [Bacilli bacterium]|nr:DNA primase [Bacilli bacterium]